MFTLGFFFFFFNDTATTEIYTLSLHDALPICTGHSISEDYCVAKIASRRHADWKPDPAEDRKSTRLNSSHDQISYAVFCLKKKKKTNKKKSDTFILREVTSSIDCDYSRD